MLDDTKEIIHTELVQCTEATSSGAMEPLGFRRGLTELLDLGLEVEVMTTDRSSSIRKIMREQYPNIQHEFDIWHTAKGFRNKILTKGKKKDTAILLAWTRSIVNHMWYTCATSKGNIEALQNRWKSIIHHVCCHGNKRGPKADRLGRHRGVQRQAVTGCGSSDGLERERGEILERLSCQGSFHTPPQQSNCTESRLGNTQEKLLITDIYKDSTRLDRTGARLRI
nr:uncharacterized protein LOC129438550 [Misgurnus anguillicaudatus]